MTVTAALAGSGGNATVPGGTTPPSPTGSPSTPTTVPWVDTPATYSPPAHPTFPTARPCTPADLSTTAGIAQNPVGIVQEDAAVVMVKNISDSRCTLSGTPGLVTGAGGGYQPVPAGPGSPPEGIGITYPASINPQEDAYVQLGKSDTCGNGKPVAAGNLALVVDGVPVQIPDLTLTGSCSGIHVSRWFSFHPDPASAFAALRSHIVIDGPAHPGQPFTYAVDITNASGAAVSLDQCPVYGEALGKATYTYRLNCAPGSIGPGQTVRFAMRIDVPANQAAGRNTLAWTIIEATDVAADEEPVTIAG